MLPDWTVVTACVIIFGPRPGGMSSLVKALVALVIGFAPNVATFLSSSKTDKKKKRMV